MQDPTRDQVSLQAEEMPRFEELFPPGSIRDYHIRVPAEPEKPTRIEMVPSDPSLPEGRGDGGSSAGDLDPPGHDADSNKQRCQLAKCEWGEPDTVKWYSKRMINLEFYSTCCGAKCEIYSDPVKDSIKFWKIHLKNKK